MLMVQLVSEQEFLMVKHRECNPFNTITMLLGFVQIVTDSEDQEEGNGEERILDQSLD